MYNLTNITDANSTLQMIQAINTDLTGGVFIMLMLLSLFVIILINMSFFNPSSAFMVAGFIVSVISGLLWVAELLPTFILVVAMVMPLIGIFWVMFSS